VNWTLNVRPAASKDIAEAYRWCEQQQTGLGKRFLDAVEQAFQRISTMPELYPCVLRDARRVLMRNFPYSIFFRVKGGEVRILGVIHQHRHPQHWMRRLQ
jgi:plasmid stabilization system protein ParE